jgi:hypothetical protein
VFTLAVIFTHHVWAQQVARATSELHMKPAE